MGLQGNMWQFEGMVWYSLEVCGGSKEWPDTVRVCMAIQRNGLEASQRNGLVEIQRNGLAPQMHGN